MKDLIDWLKRKVTYEEFRFARIVIKHRLLGKVDLHIFQDGSKLTWTLLSIIEEGEECNVALPASFINDVKKLAKRCERSWQKRFGKNSFKFTVSSEGVTAERIREEQQAWESHCQLFFVVYD